MAVLESGKRRTLTEADELLAQLQQNLERAAQSGALDHEIFVRLGDTSRALARRVNESLPPEVDPRAGDEIRRRLISILTLPTDDQPDLDVADRFLMELEAVRHILRDLVQEQTPVDPTDARALIGLLEGWLPRLTVKEIAELVGVSTRQLQRFRREGGTAPYRAALVARLVAILRHAWTNEGVAAWFRRPRPEFDGARPIDLVDDPSNEQRLMFAARSGRVQGGV